MHDDAARLGIGTELLLEVIRDAVVVADATTERIVVWNPAATEMFGFSAAEALGMPLEHLVPIALRDAHRRGVRRFAETGSGDLIDSHRAVSLTATCADGTEIAVELTLTPD